VDLYADTNVSEKQTISIFSAEDGESNVSPERWYLIYLLVHRALISTR
jgi:hypothetical protein